jgi:hypothetical protein
MVSQTVTLDALIGPLLEMGEVHLQIINRFNPISHYSLRAVGFYEPEATIPSFHYSVLA